MPTRSASSWSAAVAFPDWFDSRKQQWPEPVSETQLGALVDLLIALRYDLPSLRTLAGHDELDRRWVAASDDPAKRVRRKLDPGPDFPWDRVAESHRVLSLRGFPTARPEGRGDHFFNVRAEPLLCSQSP